ncbi:methyltransferase-domain-containing protein [Trametes meyenii]|nr:methyltransferase-domain-containing protein [Trametes meyenii]
MSLFEVPGWSVPSAPVPQQHKKRKRPSTKDTVDDADEAQRIKAAQKNIEKLMATLGAGSGDLEEGGSEKPRKKKREAKEKEKVAQVLEPERGRNTGRAGKGVDVQSSSSKSQKKNGESKARPPIEELQEQAGPSKKKRKQQQKQNPKAGHTDPADAPSDPESSHQTRAQLTSPTSNNVEKASSKKSVDKRKNTEKPQGLTALQANMKKSLDGARFRWINEMLYKSDSAKAHELMSSDPDVFADYHTGFRHQVESWPTNPVSHYISALSSYPARTVITDLGCGDAALARALIPRGFTVLSFDLRPDGAYVIEADTCARVPLPGSEKPLNAATSSSGDDTEVEGEGQVVDVVICALSLMGTNWPGCIREAWRILKNGGEFKIAEVTSRFTDVTEFTSFISSFGFKLVSKDERNTHFTLFEFKKTSRKSKSDKEWKKIMSRGDILKPCEYKRR